MLLLKHGKSTRVQQQVCSLVKSPETLRREKEKQNARRHEKTIKRGQDAVAQLIISPFQLPGK